MIKSSMMTKPALHWLFAALCGASMQYGCAKKSSPKAETDAAVGLPDNIAGKACKQDSDCMNGRCATALHLTSADDTQEAPGGYCTLACDTDSHCGANAECSVPAGEDTGECMGSCDDDTQCRDGYKCVGADQLSSIRLSGTCQPKPPADQLADGVVGQTCSSDSACQGGECLKTSPLGPAFPGSYCSGRCSMDSQCGAGGACLVFANSADAGHCYARCESDDDCTRQGYRCRELGTDFDACYPAPTSLPDNTAGNACSSDLDCGAGKDSCAIQLPFANLLGDGTVPAPGGYCTQDCSLDADCGAGGRCVSGGVTGGKCLATCETNDDCRAGYTCIADGRDHGEVANVCIPAQ
jgi:hypothetical protein